MNGKNGTGTSYAVSLALAIIVIFASYSFAQGGLWVNGTYVQDIVQSNPANVTGTSPFAGASWVANYRIIALLAALAVIVGTALAYFAGGALESESLKSWGRMELGQALATAFLIGAFIGILAVMDVVMEESAKNIIPPCGPEGTWDYEHAKPLDPPGPAILPEGSPRALQYAVCYINQIYDMASLQAQSDLKKSLEFTRLAYTSQGMQGTNWWTLWFGFYSRPNAEMRMQAEMSGLQFEIVKNMMISLQAQKFLVGQISAVLGPTFLLLGIILRTLPFTRRAGGMLLALSIGLLVILPSAYMLSWSTLVIAVYGNSVLGGPAENLPAGMPDACESCRQQVPAIYDGNDITKVYTPSQYQALLIQDATGNPVGYANAKAISDYNARTGKNYQTCYPDAAAAGMQIDPIVSSGCPELCRELPFPAYKQICDEKMCGQLPAQCKVIRWINQTHFDAAKTPYCEKWNDDGAFGCSDECTTECKAVQPQISAPDASTQPVVTENSCSECTACPLRCRVYSVRDGKPASLSDPACQTAECNACYSNPDKFKSCSLGLSAFASNEGCNHASLCGPSRSIAEIDRITPGYNDVCPLECRIYFDNGADAYKDPVYAQMCDIQSATNTKGRFYDACQRCPNACKVNATKVGAALSTANPVNFILTPQIGNCSSAPTFDSSGNMEKGDCTGCPVACRLKNPSPIDISIDPFLSHANFNITCYYEASGGVAGSPIGKDACRNLQAALGYNTVDTYSSYYQYSLDGKTWCGPTSSVHKLAFQPLNGLCPQYYNDPNGANMYPDPNNANYLIANIPSQQRAAPECLGDEVKAACEDTLCPASCKSDWPVFCTLENPQDQYSRIYENEQNCQACKNLNPNQNTTGRQCQVLLKYDGLQAENPELCDASCKASVNCKQGCFPTFLLPENATCGEYNANSDLNKSADDWKNCAACPYDCRYDYAGSPPVGWEEKCGMKMLSDLRDPDWPYNASQKIWACGNENATKYCDTNSLDRIVPNTTGTAGSGNFNPYNICSTNKHLCTKVTSATKFWYCYFGNAPHDCAGYFQVDGSHPQDWWTNPSVCAPSGSGMDGCWESDDPNLFFGYISFNPQSADLFECVPSDPYSGLNEWVNSTLGVTVCGTLDDASGDWNFCGNVTYGTNTTSACDLRIEPLGCSVEYNASVMSCSGVNWNNGTPPDKSGCQWCPPSCRIATDTSPPNYAYCPQYSVQPLAPSCDGTSCNYNCRVTIGPNNPPSNLTLDGSTCKAPTIGSGKSCPARCRTYFEGWTGTTDWDTYCNAPPYDCSDLVQECRAGVPARACEACSRCETDCLATPYVRQNCDEVCETDAEVRDFNPSSMIGRWGDGVDAWPDHRTIGAIGIAAVVLPLFALMIVMAFVRVLSPFLGGDIEIPGLMRFL